MENKLLLLHQYINDISLASNEEEFSQISENYRKKLCLDSKSDAIYKLWLDIQMLGKEILFLKTNGADASRSKRLAALSTEERAELAEVERIIDENRFNYHFQPIVSAGDGKIYSYEALMRPKTEMGMTPFHILKYADLMGKMNEIERATFLNVLSIIDGDKDHFKGRRVFINSIPKTKLEGDDFRRVGELLMKHSDTAVVELTEQAEPDENELNALKERYRNMDVKIAIDDYGTGYSNVKNLLRYMPNYVKIDRSLLSDIQSNPKKRHFVREIIEFCHENNILALAEGVETSEELRAVILMGADLIQGFYTARPNAEIIDEISYGIRQEIKLYQQERQDGKDQQVYTAGVTERIQLDRLVKDDCKCILVGKEHSEESYVAIIGSPSLDTDIHIEVAKDYKGKIILENVHLSNVKNRPCIDIGDNSCVTLILNGENKLDKSGIRVPEGARLELEGEGDLHISIIGAQYYGIGNDASSRHGEIVFNQSGLVNITASGKEGVGIGAGLGGNVVVEQGRYSLNLSGDTGVGLGALYADCSIELVTCEFNAELSLAKGTAIGSVSKNADIHITKSSANLSLGGSELTAIGTVGGERATILINDAIAMINMSTPRCTCAGSLEGCTELTVERAAFRATAIGVGALPFGGSNGNTRASFLDANTTIKLETDLDINKYISDNSIEFVRGTISFVNHDNEIDL